MDFEIVEIANRLSGQCKGCAYLKGGAAYKEPYNRMKGLICALSGVPFLCHSYFDWGSLPEGQWPPLDKAVPCAGWVAVMGRLEQEGWYEGDRRALRILGERALYQLQQWVECKGPEREVYLHNFKTYLLLLARKRERREQARAEQEVERAG